MPGVSCETWSVRHSDSPRRHEHSHAHVRCTGGAKRCRDGAWRSGDLGDALSLDTERHVLAPAHLHARAPKGDVLAVALGEARADAERAAASARAEAVAKISAAEAAAAKARDEAGAARDGTRAQVKRERERRGALCLAMWSARARVLASPLEV